MSDVVEPVAEPVAEVAVEPVAEVAVEPVAEVVNVVPEVVNVVAELVSEIEVKADAEAGLSDDVSGTVDASDEPVVDKDVSAPEPVARVDNIAEPVKAESIKVESNAEEPVKVESNAEEPVKVVEPVHVEDPVKVEVAKAVKVEVVKAVEAVPVKAAPVKVESVAVDSADVLHKAPPNSPRGISVAASMDGKIPQPSDLRLSVAQVEEVINCIKDLLDGRKITSAMLLRIVANCLRLTAKMKLKSSLSKKLISHSLEVFLKDPVNGLTEEEVQLLMTAADVIIDEGVDIIDDTRKGTLTGPKTCCVIV